MSAKIYVGNLPYECTDQDLEGLFAQFGQVASAEIVRYKKSRRSKGFGYVRMGDAQAEAAIAALNGKEFQGRRLMLAPARSEDPPAEVQQELAKQREEVKQNPPPARKPRGQAVEAPAVTAPTAAGAAIGDGTTAAHGFTPITQEPVIREAAPEDGYTFQPEPYDHELPAGGGHLMASDSTADAVSGPSGEYVPEMTPVADPVPGVAREPDYGRPAPGQPVPVIGTSAGVENDAPAAKATAGDTPKNGGGIHDDMRALGTIFSGGRKDEK